MLFICWPCCHVHSSGVLTYSALRFFAHWIASLFSVYVLVSLLVLVLILAMVLVLMEVEMLLFLTLVFELVIRLS